MPVKFTYVPPSPEALSGPAFISQTEIAINELGDHIESLESTSDEALATARSALTTATDAALTANDAQTLAQNAQDAADAAQATADAAGDKANEALDRANGAYDTAANAESKADAAGGAAGTAQNGADTAKERADDAYDLAEKADTSAASARSIASTAMGEYIVVADAVREGGDGEDDEDDDSIEDADEYFQAPEKLYFTGEKIQNFPISAPFFFDVYTNSDGTRVFQRIFNQDETWNRSAAIVTDLDRDETTATWTAWVESGMALTKDAILGAVTLTNPATDIRQAIGYNGRVYATVTLAGSPEAGPCVYEFVSSNDGSGTMCQAVPVMTKNVYFRNTTSDLTVHHGSTTYTFTATSGSVVATQEILLSYGNSGIKLEENGYGTGGTFSTDASVIGKIGLTATIDFYSNSAEFRENGFTLTVTSTDATETMTVDFPGLGDGYPESSETVCTTPTSYLRFQSGQQLHAGGTQATILITAAWMDYGGIVEWSGWKQPGQASSSAIVGEIRLLPFRPDELPQGWYFCNGDQYPLTSSQGMALDAFSTNFKMDWRINVSESNISLPNLFSSDGRGLFIRAVDGNTRQPGSFEDDKFQSHSHSWGGVSNTWGNGNGSGGVVWGSHPDQGTAGFYVSGPNSGKYGAETNPANIGMIPAIYLGL